MKYESNQLSKSNYQFMEIQRFIKTKENVQLKYRDTHYNEKLNRRKTVPFKKKRGIKEKEKLRLKSLI